MSLALSRAAMASARQTGTIFVGLHFAYRESVRADLEARFGEAYRACKARVPRWLGLPRSAAIFILLEAAKRH